MHRQRRVFSSWHSLLSWYSISTLHLIQNLEHRRNLFSEQSFHSELHQQCRDVLHSRDRSVSRNLCVSAAVMGIPRFEAQPIKARNHLCRLDSLVGPLESANFSQTGCIHFRRHPHGWRIAGASTSAIIRVRSAKPGEALWMQLPSLC